MSSAEVVIGAVESPVQILRDNDEAYRSEAYLLSC